jgi:hypothetical protein
MAGFLFWLLIVLYEGMRLIEVCSARDILAKMHFDDKALVFAFLVQLHIHEVI